MGPNFVDPNGRLLQVTMPGPTSDEQYAQRLVEWAALFREVPRMDRRRIYEVFGKAKPKSYYVWSGGCDCDEPCDCVQRVRRRLVHGWTEGVRPHHDIRVLRRRAERECLRRMPSPPYRYAGVELRRPMSVRYMDGV